MVESYDGSVLRFNISKEEVKNRYMRDSSPSARNADNLFLHTEMQQTFHKKLILVSLCWKTD